MPIVRIPIVDVEAWHERRDLFVNATEAAAICGEASFASLAEITAEKLHLRPRREDTPAMRRGRYGEAACFQALSDEFPTWTFRRAKIHCLDYDRRLAATPDGFATAPDRSGFVLVEAKCVAGDRFRSRWLEDPMGDLLGPANVPVNYLLQTTTTRLLCADECRTAVLAVLIIVDEWNWILRTFDIEPNPALEDRISYCAAEYCKNYLDQGILPPFDVQRDEQLVKLLYPKDDGTEIDLSQDNRAVAATEELVQTRDALRRLEKQESALKTELTAKIGAHTVANLGAGVRLSWKTQHRKAYAVEASDSRVLRVLKGPST